MAHHRVRQWATMSRTWWLYDAKNQCAFRSAEKLMMYLEGRHKPLYHPLSDVGDHVVVINCRKVALAEDLWRTYKYSHDTGYKHGKSEMSAWRLQDVDPIQLLQRSVYRAGPKTLERPNMMQRLHLYADETTSGSICGKRRKLNEVPKDIMENVTDVIRQVQVVPKALDQYSKEEVDSFPKLFDWPENHILFKRKTFEEQMKEKLGKKGAADANTK